MDVNMFSDNLDKFVQGCISAVRDIPDTNVLAKGQQIQNITAVIKKVETALSTLTQFVGHEQNQLLESIKIIENNLIQARNMVLGEPPEVDDQDKSRTWISVVKPTTKTKIKYTPVTLSPPQQVKREIADGVYIHAYTISSPEAAHDYRGFWCYIQKYNRFYLSINNIILEAITSNIIPAEITPTKCLEHRNISLHGNTSGLDWQKTKFYIPRQYDPESKDVRQFTARMKFVPASKELRENEIYTMRLGSRDTLGQDIAQVLPEDKRLYNDYVGNLLLCFTAANDIKK